MMKITSAEAAKLLRQLTEQHSSLCMNEENSKEFLASLGEDVESVRPKYDFPTMQNKLDEIEGKIRKLKHAINHFNVTHTVPGFDLTVDQMLVFIPQTNRKRDKLYAMKNRLPKTRESATGYGKNNALIDYNYANYAIEDAAKEYDKISDILAKAQTALDLLNSTETMEIDL